MTLTEALFQSENNQACCKQNEYLTIIVHELPKMNKINCIFQLKDNAEDEHYRVIMVKLNTKNQIESLDWRPL